MPRARELAELATSYDSGGLLGFRNRIINGDMRIDQRNNGAAQTITAGVNTYTVDRWFCVAAGANVTGQRVAGSGNNQFNYRYTGAASVTSISHLQRIESNNCYDLVGQTATLSVNLANSVLTTVNWRIDYAGGTDNWALSTTIIASGSFTVSSTLTNFTAQVSIPAAATTGLQVLFSVGAQTSGTWTIGQVQLEAGSVATPFERRDYGRELIMCQRYLPALNSASTQDYFEDGYVATTTTAYGLFDFLVTPRVPPTGITVSNAGHFTVLMPSGATMVCTSVTFSVASYKTCRVAYVGASGLTANQPCQMYFNNASGQLLFTGCEL